MLCILGGYSPEEARYRADMLASCGVVSEIGGDVVAASEYSGDISADVLILATSAAADIALVKAQSKGRPVVLWGAVGQNARELLLSGADEVLSQAMSIDEVEARLSLVLGRAIVEPNVRSYAGAVLDIESNEVSFHGFSVRLTRLEAGFLDALMHAKGRVLGKQELMDRVYSSFEQPEVKLVDVVMCKLRAKTGKLPFEIETVWGQGNRLRRRGATC